MLLKSVFPFIHVTQATENKLLKYASPVKRHWVILTDRCWFSKISEGSEAITMSLLQAFFFSTSSRSHRFSHRLFHLFLKCCVQNQPQHFSLPRLRQGGFLWPAPVLVFLCLFHESVTLLLAVSCWSAGTLLPEAFPRALSSNAEHIMHSGSPRCRLKRGTLCTCGTAESGPLFFSGYFSDCRDHFEFCPCLQDTCNPL